MREILFKAKRKDNNEWVEGYLFKTPLTAEFNCDGQYFSSMVKRICISNEDGCAFEVIPETICEYTGLTDKNGVKIFENDIVKNDEFTLIVVYNPRETKFALLDKEIFIDQCSETLSDCDDIDETFVDDRYFEYSCGSYEVIGNIFDEEVK